MSPIRFFRELRRRRVFQLILIYSAAAWGVIAASDVLLPQLVSDADAATRFYVGCACKAGVVLINNIPVFIASDPGRRWANHLEEADLLVIVDDIKSRLGATIAHCVLASD